MKPDLAETVRSIRTRDDLHRWTNADLRELSRECNAAATEIENRYDTMPEPVRRKWKHLMCIANWAGHVLEARGQAKQDEEAA